MTTLPAGTVTFLISDIEGSTRRWSQGDLSAALAQHDRVTRSAIEAQGGYWIKHTGDGALTAFADADSAVRAAIELQRGLLAAQWQDAPVAVRVGLNTGSASPVGDDYFGLPVSVAARVSDAAHAGQILLSEATRSVLSSAQHLEFDLIDLGRHELKDLEESTRLFQVKVPGLGASFPPPRTRAGASSNLPVELTSFIGRDAELTELVQLIGQHRLVTVTGVGGAGKTRLTVEAARQAAANFRDGAWMVELAPLRSHEGVASTTASALGMRFEEGDPVDTTERIVERLARMNALLVVDNCEHVLSATGALVGRLLVDCPDVTIVGSSREGLSVPGERIWQIPSMSPEGDASALFVERARDAAANLELEPDTRRTVHSICRLLDGVPLAIELAAVRCRVLTPAQIEERLVDRFQLLTGGSSLALPRHQTLEATIDWSYRLLSRQEQALFDRLAVFHDGFGLTTVEEICTDEAVTRSAVLDLLASLHDKSMIQVGTSDSDRRRYGMLETLRHYAVRRLEDSGETSTWKTRHHDWFASAAADRHDQDSGARISGEDATDYSWLQREAANLAAALDWARATGTDAVGPLAEVLGIHRFGNMGEPGEALALLDEALASLPEHAFDRRAEVLARTVWVTSALGDISSMLNAGDQAVALAQSKTTPAATARVLSQVASVYAFEPEVDGRLSVPLARQAVEIARDGDPETAVIALRALAWSLIWVDGTYDEIAAVSEEIRRLATHIRRAPTWGYDALLLATMTLDYANGTDLTSSIEDGVLDSLPEPDAEFDAWTGIRRCDWQLAQRGLDGLRSVSQGFMRKAVLMPQACMLWMRGRLEEADRTLASVRDLGRIGRWHHDFFPTLAEVACQQGEVDRVAEVVEEHLALSVKEIEEPMKLGTMRAHTQALVDTGDLRAAEAVVDRMRSIRADHPRRMSGSVQLGSPEGYLACAEAELTRLTGPDPKAWARAGRMTIWEYWKVYCQARAAEATHRLGDDASALLAGARARAKQADAQWVLSWLP